jgi:hypothetical protein
MISKYLRIWLISSLKSFVTCGSDTLRATDADGACLNGRMVLASAAQAVDKIVRCASPLAGGAYPFASAAVAAFFGGNPESRRDLAGCSASGKPYATGLHLLFTVPHA